MAKRKLKEEIDSLRLELEVPTWRPCGNRPESEVCQLLEEAKAQLSQIEQGEKVEQKRRLAARPTPQAEAKLVLPAEPPPAVMAARRNSGSANQAEQSDDPAVPEQPEVEPSDVLPPRLRRSRLRGWNGLRHLNQV